MKNDKKTLLVVITRHRDILVDGCLVETDKDLKLYEGFNFIFEGACYLVKKEMIDKVKDRFRRLKLIE